MKIRISDNFVLNFEITGDWGSGANWQMEIINNTGRNINVESIAFDFEKQITACYQGEFNSIGAGRYQIINYNWSSYIEKGKSLYIYGQSIGNIANKTLGNVEIKFR